MDNIASTILLLVIHEDIKLFISFKVPLFDVVTSLLYALYIILLQVWEEGN